MLLSPKPDIPPEVLRQHGQEELEHLRRRVGLWREDFLRQAPAGGGREWLFLVKEFHAEIDEWLYPYVRRLVETEHITAVEGAEFMDFCYQQVLVLAEHLGIVEGVPEGAGTATLPLIYK